MHEMGLRIILILTLALLACDGSGGESENIGIGVKLAVAADFAEVALRLGSDFTARTGLMVDVTSDSSGALTSQIRSGAEFDVFLSANTGFPLQLIEEGLAVPKPVVYAIGTLESLELFDLLEETFVFGENVSKTLELVETGSADAGFVAFPDLDNDNQALSWIVLEQMQSLSNRPQSCSLTRRTLTLRTGGWTTS